MSGFGSCSPRNANKFKSLGIFCLCLSVAVRYNPRRSVGPSVGRAMGKLTDRTVRTVGPGRHGDGAALALVVSDTGARKWVLRYQLNGKRRDMGLGGFPDVDLKSARLAAGSARALAARGVDPLAARDDARKAARPIPTFADIARDVIAEAQARTANEKVRYQWERHLGPAYCGALLGRPVNEITTGWRPRVQDGRDETACQNGTAFNFSSRAKNL